MGSGRGSSVSSRGVFLTRRSRSRCSSSPPITKPWPHKPSIQSSPLPPAGGRGARERGGGRLDPLVAGYDIASMRGRFLNKLPAAEIARNFGTRNPLPNYPARFNTHRRCLPSVSTQRPRSAIRRRETTAGLTGPVRIIDGDTIVIDALGSEQSCQVPASPSRPKGAVFRHVWSPYGPLK
jgi:hypothetical protein